jgi:hypothetical protein
VAVSIPPDKKQEIDAALSGRRRFGGGGSED